jgi:hypothetical protein
MISALDLPQRNIRTPHQPETLVAGPLLLQDASRWQESIRSASKKTVAEAECSQLPPSALLVQKDHVVVREAHGIA